MQDIGFIGLGAMGAPMARHLLTAGFELHIFDTNAETAGRFSALGAHIHTSPRAVADAADAVLVCLPTPDIVKYVALGEDGIIHGRRAKIYVDHSTTGPSVAREVAEPILRGCVNLSDEELKALQAKVEAQSFVIDRLLSACVESGLLDPAKVAQEFLRMRSGPTFIGADPKAKRLLACELESWAEVIIGKYLPEGVEPPGA